MQEMNIASDDAIYNTTQLKNIIAFTFILA